MRFLIAGPEGGEAGAKLTHALADAGTDAEFMAVRRLHWIAAQGDATEAAALLAPLATATDWLFSSALAVRAWLAACERAGAAPAALAAQKIVWSPGPETSAYLRRAVIAPTLEAPAPYGHAGLAQVIDNRAQLPGAIAASGPRRFALIGSNQPPREALRQALARLSAPHEPLALYAHQPDAAQWQRLAAAVESAQWLLLMTAETVADAARSPAASGAIQRALVAGTLRLATFGPATTAALQRHTTWPLALACPTPHTEEFLRRWQQVSQPADS